MFICVYVHMYICMWLAILEQTSGLHRLQASGETVQVEMLRPEHDVVVAPDCVVQPGLGLG